MTAPVAGSPVGHSRHGFLWLCSVAAAFVGGIWTTHRFPALCTASTASTASSASSASTASAAGAGGATASPTGTETPNAPSSGGLLSKLAAAMKGAGGGATGDVGASPTASPASGAGETSSASSGSGAGGDPAAPGSSTAGSGDPDPSALARGYAMSNASLGPTSPDSASAQPGSTTLTAKDFTYDVTGMPRYPNAISNVASARTTKDGAPADTGSTCVLLTSDSFEKVAAWYHAQLPSDWHEAIIPNFDALGKGLSVANIGKMLTSIRPGSTPTANSVLDTTGNSADHLSVAVWQPSTRGGETKGVMVVTKTGKPTEIILKRRVGA